MFTFGVSCQRAIDRFFLFYLECVFMNTRLKEKKSIIMAQRMKEIMVALRPTIVSESTELSTILA